MSLTQQDVIRIAKLARISISEQEVAKIGDELNSIFGLIEKMQLVNTDGIEPMAHPQDVSLRLRDDVVTEVNHREAFQSIAPQVEKGLFLVPKVIE